MESFLVRLDLSDSFSYADDLEDNASALASPHLTRVLIRIVQTFDFMLLNGQRWLWMLMGNYKIELLCYGQVII